jgi:hypothetical protein
MRSRPKPKFASASQHTYRIDLVLDFAAPVTALHAKEAARRILDGLQLSTEHARMDVDLRSAELLCHPLHRVVALATPERTDGGPRLSFDALDVDDRGDDMRP